MELPSNGLGLLLPTYNDAELLRLLDIPAGARVLDVGGGARPFSRADVVVDMFLHDNIHRGGLAARFEGAEFVEASVEALPFDDGAFDVVVCRHVLEHVGDPEAACRELARVAARGYIETPSRINEIMHGYPNHVWMVSNDGDGLRFEPKRFVTNPFRNISRLLHFQNPEFQAAFEQTYRNVFCTQLYWEGPFPVIVEDRRPGDFDYSNRHHAAAAHFDYALNYMFYGLDQIVPDEVTEHLERAATLAGKGSAPEQIALLFRHRAELPREQLMQKVIQVRSLDMLDAVGANKAPAGPARAAGRSRTRGGDAAPAVSVVVRTFNRPDHLARALCSLEDQTLTDIEVIVVDDAGTDVTDVVAAFEDRLDVTLVRHERNKGRTAALNSGLARARGRYICFLDDDDVFYSGHLALLVGEAEKAGGHRVVYSQALKAVEDGAGNVVERVLEHDQPFDAALFLVTNYIPNLALLIPRDLLVEVGGFDEHFTVLEDWECWIRLSKVNQFVYVPRATAEYRVRGDGTNCTAREWSSFAPATHDVFAKHPVAAGPVADARRRFLEATGRVAPTAAAPAAAPAAPAAAAAPVFEHSFVIDGGEAPASLLATLESVITAMADAPFEVLVAAGDGPEMTGFLGALEGDVVIVTSPTDQRATALAQLRARARGTSRHELRAGETFHLPATSFAAV